MGLEIEVWHETIQEKLKEDNSFLSHIADVDEDHILGGALVHIPQAGEPSGVVKNRTVVPATPAKRVDSDIIYKIDEYTTDPIYISNKETVELSYDKRKSVLDQDISNLSEEVADGMLHNFIVSPVGDNQKLPTTSILKTEGADVDSGLAGSTGKRKAYSIRDLQRLRNFLKRQKSWSEGNMHVLLTPDAEDQMFPADSNATVTAMASVTEEERRNGIMYKAQGFYIHSRSGVYILDSTGEFKAPGAINEEDDSEGILAWNKNMLEKAIGSTKAFARENDPTYYGDIYSFLVRMGGRARRKNYEGVAVLMQAPTA